LDDIPVAHTPSGGYGEAMPPPILGACSEPLAEGAPDLRGMWEVVSVEVGGEVAVGHPAVGNSQRIEQCGDRLVVTAAGIIHDMRCDGILEHGVHDVMQTDYTTPVNVVATYENGVHVLRPDGLPIEVRRRRDGDQMVWDYVGFTARLDRIGDIA
jgi:hypothetical protein